MIYRRIPIDSSEYPVNLRKIPIPPGEIYVLGKMRKKDHKAVAIVGTRRMTEYGKKMARSFSGYLARKGFTIVSGLARGVDTIAHKEALKNDGRTIAILGSGIDVIYPPENIKLAAEIIKSGVVMTEFPPGTKPLGMNFLVRNRIISGMSLAVIIIEGKIKSGTISTAIWAANHNREVFAVPGRADSPMSEAPNYLISQGARVASRPEEVYEYLTGLL